MKNDVIQIFPDKMCQFSKSEDIRNYIHGGKGVLLLEAPSGKHHRYCFTIPREYEKFDKGTMFVYILCHNGYKSYVGMVENDVFRLTRHSKFAYDSEIVKGAFYIMKMSNNQNLVDTTPMKLYHMGVCCRCGRELTTLSSIKSGIGPKCKKKLEIPYIGNIKCWD